LRTLEQLNEAIGTGGAQEIVRPDIDLLYFGRTGAPKVGDVEHMGSRKGQGGAQHRADGGNQLPPVFGFESLLFELEFLAFEGCLFGLNGPSPRSAARQKRVVERTPRLRPVAIRQCAATLRPM
jgi:hypothetical protein